MYNKPTQLKGNKRPSKATWLCTAQIRSQAGLGWAGKERGRAMMLKWETAHAGAHGRTDGR